MKIVIFWSSEPRGTFGAFWKGPGGDEHFFFKPESMKQIKSVKTHNHEIKIMKQKETTQKYKFLAF